MRQQPVVFVGEDAFVVIGILEDVKRQPELLNAVILPEGTARDRFAYASASTVQIDVDIGAAPLIGAVTGLLAGLYPALRAARLEPVDALRAG